MKHSDTLRLSAALFVLAACQPSEAEQTVPAAPAAGVAAEHAAEVTNTAAAEEPGSIRNVRVNPSATTVEISFTALPGATAMVSIGPTPPLPMPLPANAARDSGPRSMLALNPDGEHVGYAVRSSSASYVLNTARDRPEESWTNSLATLRPGTTYHFIISAPARAPQPGDDGFDMLAGVQHAGKFTTLP